MGHLRKDIVSDTHLPDSPNFRSWHRQRRPKAIRDSIETNSGLKPELVGAEESLTDGATVHRWLFEVEGGHGRTLWTRRRIEDTRPSIVDPVVVLDAAHGSHRVTQKNRSSILLYLGVPS